MNQSELINRFAAGATRGQASSLFIEHDVLYSYGHHFPLLVRKSWGNLRNADKYSVTTTAHQSMCEDITTLSIPFSIFNRAGINFRNGLELKDRTAARYDHRTYRNKEGELIEVSERRPESAVFEHNGTCFLSSMDGDNYFMTELPKPVETVQEAFDSLVPEGIEGTPGVDYLRQGEWFFKPVPKGTRVSRIRKGERGLLRLQPRNMNTQPHHYATEYANLEDGTLVVRGTVRHTEGDHPMLKLGDGKQWFIPLESNHVESWGAGTRVD